MLFAQSVFALAALASTAYAQVAGFDAITNPSAADQQVAAGSSFDITWLATTFTSDKDTVSIILLAGETPNTLQPATTPIASSIKNSVGKYTWTVPSSTATTYGFKIVLDSDPATFQYSFPFHITGGSSSSSSSSSVSGSSSASASVTASTNTSSAASSSVTATGNSTIVKTDVLTSTVCTKCLGSNSTISASTIAPPAVTPSSNISSLATSVTATKTSAAGGGSTVAASSGTAAATASGNAAVSNVAQGGLALIGGLVLAFAL